MDRSDVGVCELFDEQKTYDFRKAPVIAFLKEANVESRPVWKPMHTQKLYEHAEVVGGKVAEDINARGICLPSSSSLSLEDQQFIIERVREAHFQTRAEA